MSVEDGKVMYDSCKYACVRQFQMPRWQLLMHWLEAISNMHEQLMLLPGASPLNVTGNAGRIDDPRGGLQSKPSQAITEVNRMSCRVDRAVCTRVRHECSMNLRVSSRTSHSLMCQFWKWCFALRTRCDWEWLSRVVYTRSVGRMSRSLVRYPNVHLVEGRVPIASRRTELGKLPDRFVHGHSSDDVVCMP